MAKVVLRITEELAGDNYIVEVSCDEDFSAPMPTAPLVAWRRVYVEIDRMFKQGSLLARDASPGDTTLGLLEDAAAAGIDPGDRVAIFDNQGGVTLLRTVTAVSGADITIDPPLTESFEAGGFNRNQGSTVVVPVPNPDVFDVADVTDLAAVFGEAFGAETDGSDEGGFTEVKPSLVAPEGVFPHAPQGVQLDNVDRRQDLATKWFESRDRPLHFHLILADRAGKGRVGNSSPRVNAARSERHTSYIAVGLTDAVLVGNGTLPAAQRDEYLREVIVHEIGHSWFPNKAEDRRAEHFGAKNWDGSADCIMDNGADAPAAQQAAEGVRLFTNGITEFETTDLFFIRGHEPLPGSRQP